MPDIKLFEQMDPHYLHAIYFYIFLCGIFRQDSHLNTTTKTMNIVCQIGFDLANLTYHRVVYISKYIFDLQIICFQYGESTFNVQMHKKGPMPE